jgi:hypothetical protein
MGRSINPYPKIIKDEDTGVNIPNRRYDDWENGYKSRAANVIYSGFYKIATSIIHQPHKITKVQDRTIDKYL